MASPDEMKTPKSTLGGASQRSLVDNTLDDVWQPGESAQPAIHSGPEFLLLSRGDITREQLDEAVAKQQEA